MKSGGNLVALNKDDGYLIGKCDQQFNGFGTFHKIGVRFALMKDLKRRRRLSGDKAGEVGDFGYTMDTGKCIAKDANDKSCDGEGSTTAGSFGLLVSLLTL